VVTAALRLLDEAGLDGLTLRRLAQELGVQAPALYWHFKNKQELLDYVAEAIGDEVRLAARPDPDQPWDTWLTEGMRLHRRALLSHRDGARVVAGNRPTEKVLPVVEDLLRRLCAEGFTAGYAMASVLALGAYVGGFVLEEQAEQRRYGEPGVRERDEERFGAVDWSAYPTMYAAFGEMNGPPGSDRAFDYGLQLVIDGMWAHLARTTGRAGSPSTQVEAGERA